MGRPGRGAGSPVWSAGLRARAAAVWLHADEARRLAGFAYQYRWRIAGAMVLLAAATGLGLAVPWALATLTDEVLVAGAGQEDALAELTRITLALLGVFALRALVTAGQVLWLAQAGEGIVRDVRCALYDHLVGLGPTFFDERRVGEIVSRVMNDVARMQSVLTVGMAELVGYSLTLVGAFGILVWRSWVLALAILVIVPPVVLAARLFGRQQHRLSVDVQDRMADASSVVEETLGAIRLVQIFEREPYERSRFRSASDGLRAAAVRRARSQALFGPAVNFMTFGSLALVLWLAGAQVVAGELLVGDLVAFVGYAAMIGASGSGLVTLYGRWAGAVGATRRVLAWLDTRPAVVGRPGAVEPGSVRGAVALEGVRFAYPHGEEVLRDVSLEVPAGATVALVGPTGAGKSTIMHLVARFYDPTAGVVRLDGRDVRTLTLHGLRQGMGVVPQETVLFNATVRENLRYGRLGATDAEIEEAARTAFAHDFIAALPAGYDTVVGERGIRLSAGQRQRIAIARALLKDPRVLLLDEATSSLDNESERRVQAAVEALLVGRTTIVVAHRLSTVRTADQIAVIDRGRVVELGRHDELLMLRGLYERLHALEFRVDPVRSSASAG